jgi:hypothetical protein
MLLLLVVREQALLLNIQSVTNCRVFLKGSRFRYLVRVINLPENFQAGNDRRTSTLASSFVPVVRVVAKSTRLEL